MQTLLLVTSLTWIIPSRAPQI